MCTNYPKIIITSPKEPAAFCPVPQTVQENLLTTNYEQWCALYSMDDDNISLDYVSSDLRRHKQQQYENDYYYNREYNDFEEDDYFDNYSQKYNSNDMEYNNYNEEFPHREYCNYDNYYENNEKEDYDSEFDYDELNDNYDDEEIFYMEKEPVIQNKSRPRLNYDILANAINRRFHNSTDSDTSVESQESEEEFEKEDSIESKIVVKKTPSIVIPSNSLKNHRNFFPKEILKDDEEDYKMSDYMETIKNKFGQKEVSSSVPIKSGFSIMNEVISEGQTFTFGFPEAMSNKHGARSAFLTHRKSNSLQSTLLEKTFNGSISSSLKKDSEIILNGPMKNRKRAFSLNEQNEFRIIKSFLNNNNNNNNNNNKIEFNDSKRSFIISPN
jgi:hypothetical protein